MGQILDRDGRNHALVHFGQFPQIPPTEDHVVTTFCPASPDLRGATREALLHNDLNSAWLHFIKALPE